MVENLSGNYISCRIKQKKKVPWNNEHRIRVRSNKIPLARGKVATTSVCYLYLTTCSTCTGVNSFSQFPVSDLTFLLKNDISLNINATELADEETRPRVNSSETTLDLLTSCQMCGITGCGCSALSTNTFRNKEWAFKEHWKKPTNS